MPVDGAFSTQMLPNDSAPRLISQLPATGVVDFRGKVALVMGAGSLIGRAVIQAFVAKGVKVFAVGADPKELEELYSGFSRASCIVMPCTNPSAADMEAVVQRCLDAFGNIDFLINGSLPQSASDFLEISSEEFARIYHEAVTCALLTMRFVIPHMVGRGTGAIVNMSSLAAHRYLRPEAAHAASAAAVNALTMQTAAEFAHQGIRCNAIMSTSTDQFSKQEAEDYSVGIADAALQLCSEKSRYTNGHLLTLDMSASARMLVNI